MHFLFYAWFSKINIYLQFPTNESRKNPRGEAFFDTRLAGARNVPPEFLNSGGYTKHTNFKAIDTKSVAFFYFTKKGERKNG